MIEIYRAAYRWPIKIDCCYHTNSSIYLTFTWRAMGTNQRHKCKGGMVENNSRFEYRSSGGGLNLSGNAQLQMKMKNSQ